MVMNKKPVCYVLAAALGISFGVVAHAAQFDFGRALDAVKGFSAAGTQVDEKQEIGIGRDIAGTVLGAAPLVNDPALQSYVNKVGRWIASQSERADLPWRFGVIETAGVNAFAAPGGYVLITRGLYELLENESQLAGVLGHEIAHILKRHHITVMQKQGLLQGFTSAGQAALGSRSGAGNVVGQAAAGAISDILTKGLDKSAEYEADHLGVVLAARAGYAPHGLVEVLHKLQARAGDPSLGLLFSTHPHPGDRLTQLGNAMTPRLANLPTGLEPVLQGVSAKAPAARAGSARKPVGARAMQQEDPQQAQGLAPAASAGIPAAPATGSGSGMGIDPGTLLRGLMRR